LTIDDDGGGCVRVLSGTVELGRYEDGVTEDSVVGVFCWCTMARTSVLKWNGFGSVSFGFGVTRVVVVVVVVET